MKIVLPVHHFPPRYSAGAELYTFRLARWLLAHGHSAEVVCVERIDDEEAHPLRASQDVYQGVPVWRLSMNLADAPDQLRWSYDNPWIGAWFADYLARTAPDLVHLQSGYLMSASVLAAASAAGVASVVTLHDFWFLCPRITLLRGDGTLCAAPPTDPAACGWCMLLDSRRYRALAQVSGGLAEQVATRVGLHGQRQGIAARRERLRVALQQADAAVAPSHFLARMYGGYVAPERLHMLRYGLDSTRLQETPPPAQDGTLRLGYIGQVAAHKGVHVLVRAIQQLPASGRPVSLTIYGDLEQHRAFSQRLRQQIGGDQRITLAGRFDNGRIAEVLGGCDAMVVPSIWYENSPLAIMESHAAGRPVLTSALGGMAELVRDEVDGLHFQPGDAADLARQIQRLRDEPDLLPRLRQGTVAPATIDDEMTTLMEIYRTTVEQRATQFAGAVA